MVVLFCSVEDALKLLGEGVTHSATHSTRRQCRRVRDAAEGLQCVRQVAVIAGPHPRPGGGVNEYSILLRVGPLESSLWLVNLEAKRSSSAAGGFLWGENRLVVTEIVDERGRRPTQYSFSGI